MQDVVHALEPVADDDARARVLRWVSEVFKLQGGGQFQKLKAGSQQVPFEQHGDQDAVQYATVADLMAAAGPSTPQDRALVVGYWFQAIKGESEFQSQTLNNELKNLGHKAKNITDVLDGLMVKKPALAIQTRKTGSARQSRKHYKLTQPGIDRVKALLSGTVSAEDARE